MISRRYYYRSSANFSRSFNDKKIVGYFFYTFFGRVFYYLLLVISIVIINLSKGNNKFNDLIRHSAFTVTKPIVFVLEMPFNLLHDFGENIKNLLMTNIRNKKLVEENLRLKRLYLESLETSSENLNLKKLLNFKDRNNLKYNFITTKVYISVKNNVLDSIVVNAGKFDGVVEGSLVVGSNNGLIGRVINVMDNYSNVLLLNDTNSKIPAKVIELKEKIILSGFNNSNLLKILFFNSKKTQIKDGDLVYTSGDSNVIPDDIFIGKVIEKDGEYFVEMTENPYNLFDVSIIIPVNKPQQLQDSSIKETFNKENVDFEGNDSTFNNSVDTPILNKNLDKNFNRDINKDFNNITDKNINSNKLNNKLNKILYNSNNAKDKNSENKTNIKSSYVENDKNIKNLVSKQNTDNKKVNDKVEIGDIIEKDKDLDKKISIKEDEDKFVKQEKIDSEITDKNNKDNLGDN